MAGEGQITRQFSDEAIESAYRSNFLFDEIGRANAVLASLSRGSITSKAHQLFSGSEYIAAHDELESIRRQFNDICAVTGSLLIRDSGLDPRAVPMDTQPQVGEVVVSLGRAFFVNHPALNDRTQRKI